MFSKTLDQSVRGTQDALYGGNSRLICDNGKSHEILGLLCVYGERDDHGGMAKGVDGVDVEEFKGGDVSP